MTIKDLPKVELHSHLELCLRPSTIKELAPQFGIELPDEKTFRERFLILEPMKDLGSVLNKFLDTQKLLGSPEILERIAFEACEDAFQVSNIRVMEFRYAPTFIRLNHEHMSFEKIHESLLKGLQRAEKTYPMATGLICIIQRILPVKEAEQVTDFAIENKDSFIGLDLADNEVGFDSKPFSSFFARAKKAGLGITVHSGEADVPNAPRYVREAIDYLGADRIGHGVQIYRDPETIEYVKSKDITLELCPTSNWLTNAIPPNQVHPFRQLFEAGVNVTINTDDGGIFNVTLNEEYERVQKTHSMTIEELQKITENAYRTSFIDEAKRAKVFPGKK
ncbi:MAG: adenosine deaminase [Bdellovibrionales bacterium]|nr:adenosine deaminase [Bdellovibrionales bacterium]